MQEQTSEFTVELTDVYVNEVQAWFDLMNENGLERIGDGVEHAHPDGGTVHCVTYSTRDQSLVMEVVTSTPEDFIDDTNDTSRIPRGRLTSVTLTGDVQRVDAAVDHIMRSFDEAEFDNEPETTMDLPDGELNVAE